MTAVPRPSPGRRFPRHCVVVHDLQLGPHTCAQSCYACPDLTAALCTRCHCANLRANTRAVSRHRPGRTRCANAPPPPPHPPAWTSFPKAGAAAGAAAGAQSFVTRAVARANERKRQGGDRRVEFGGLCGTRVFLQGCAGSFSGTSRTITSWYKRELKTRALCMGPHKSMHQLVTQTDCGHSANLWLFVRLFFPGPSRRKVETLYSCKFEVLPHSAPNGARASPRFPLSIFTTLLCHEVYCPAA